MGTQRTTADESTSPWLLQEKRWREEDAELSRRRQAIREQGDAKLRAERKAAMAAEKAARAEKERVKAEADLRGQLRLQFMKSPAASEADFERAYPQLRLDHLAKEAIEAPEREKAALRARGGYGL
jgi:hypothetical protein